MRTCGNPIFADTKVIVEAMPILLDYDEGRVRLLL
jgi:hypothetical protein